MRIFPINGNVFGIEVKRDDVFIQDKSKDCLGNVYYKDCLGLWHQETNDRLTPERKV